MCVGSVCTHPVAGREAGAHSGGRLSGTRRLCLGVGSVAIEKHNSESEDVNHSEYKVKCCHLIITVITIWREHSISHIMKLAYRARAKHTV